MIEPGSYEAGSDVRAYVNQNFVWAPGDRHASSYADVQTTLTFLPGQIFDLAGDWSDTANPNGTWAYREGNNLLPHVDWWQRDTCGPGNGGFSSAQPGWAREESGNTRVPFWFKSRGYETAVACGGTNVHNWQTGDVVVQTTEPNAGVGSGLANVTWSSPGPGCISIYGGVWMGYPLANRDQAWRLSDNGVLLRSGVVAYDQPYSHDFPFNFAVGTPGQDPSLARRPVVAGQVIKLELEAAGSGLPMGTSMTIAWEHLDSATLFGGGGRVCATGGVNFNLTLGGNDGGPFTYQWQVQPPAGSWTTVSDTPTTFSCGGNAFIFPANAAATFLTIRPCTNGVGLQQFRVRCLVFSAGGSVTSNEATYTICPADFNCSGTLTIQDIFDFLAAWFSGNPNADFNHVGGITIQDIFDFLAAWFAGC